jgi:hypothetical protein
VPEDLLEALPPERGGAVGHGGEPHLHFHCVVIDGVFEPAPAGGVVFREATGIDARAVTEVQARYET